MIQVHLPVQNSEAILPKVNDKETIITDKKETKEFLSIMLSSINKGEDSKIVKISKEILEFFPELAVNIDEELDESLSIEKASLMQLLKISEMLNGGEKSLKFPVFTEKLAKVLSNENAIKEFKNAKNLSDLIKIAKKYDLGLDKIKFSTENLKTLENKFPLLKDKEFFQSKIANLTENILKTKHSKVEKKPLIQNDDASFLKDLISQIDKEEKETKIKKSNIIETQNPKPKKREATAIKELLEKITQNQTDKKPQKEEAKPEINKAQKQEKLPNSQNLDKVIMPSANNLEDKIIDKKSAKISEKNILPTDEKQTKIPEKTILPTDEKAQKPPRKESQNAKIPENIIKNKPETNTIKTPEIMPSTEEKTIKITPKEAFEEVLKPQNAPKQIFELKPDQPKMPKPTNEIAIKTEPPKEQSQNESQNSEQEPNQNNQNSLIKDIAKAAQAQVKAPLRQTFSHFSQDLKEQIEQYKPPISKVQIALNPKNLGEVEVTIITRGNNLHISFNSNQQTMNLFIQNQQEFKNSLVNMGFTQLEMNFSDQKESKNQQNFSHKDQMNDENEELKEEQSSIELIMPKYV